MKKKKKSQIKIEVLLLKPKYFTSNTKDWQIWIWMITHSVLQPENWSPCELLRPCQDLFNKAPSRDLISDLQVNTTCWHQTITSIRELKKWYDKGILVFLIYFIVIRETKHWYQAFLAYCVVLFSPISHFFTLQYFTIFFPSVCYCWQHQSGYRA